jgi:hypothetical protein
MEYKLKLATIGIPRSKYILIYHCRKNIVIIKAECPFQWTLFETSGVLFGWLGGFHPP